MFKKLAILAIAIVGFLSFNSTVEAHHLGPKLPGVPNTPLIQNLIDDGVVVWDVDNRAANYPNFVKQLYQVNDYATEVSGIPHRRAATGERPDIIHTMPDIFPCGDGAAACIYYANPLPVIVAYNYRLGYSDWRSAQCHEGTNSGHAMGLHEYYDDINFRSLGRFWTCMDFGTYVWQEPQYDVDMIHSWVLPKPLQFYGLRYHADSTPYVFYCDGDSNVARRVALMVTDPQGNYMWTGVHLPIKGNADGVCDLTKEPVGFNIIPGAGWCFWFNEENGFNYQRGDLRNDVKVGCT